jgi:hypothetical protein
MYDWRYSENQAHYSNLEVMSSGLRGTAVRMASPRYSPFGWRVCARYAIYAQESCVFA